MSPMVKLPLAMEHALLGFLAQRPMHAYEMHQTLKDAHALGLVWHLKQSQLYALLALEDAGYIATVTELQGTRPPRKIMHLTRAGQDAFRHWLRTPVEHGRDFRQEFLAKLYFAQEDDPGTIAELAENQRFVCLDWLADLEARAAEAEPRSYDWLVLQFRIGQMQAILAWLDTCLATLVDPSPV
jgi:PadR family transcriptional regulator, regulatory protein AphA